jgi:Tol biopolymer transport system component
VYLADLVSGERRKLADGHPHWTPSAHFSGDGKWVYFTAGGQVHRVAAQAAGAPEPITEFTEFARSDEFWADRPAWSPDGRSIAFLSYQLLGPAGDYRFVVPGGLRSQVKRVSVPDGTVETLSEPAYVRAVAVLADGRPVWAEVEPESKTAPAMSRLTVSTQTDSAKTALTVEGVVDRIGVDPSDGSSGLYLRLYEVSTPEQNCIGRPE